MRKKFAHIKVDFKKKRYQLGQLAWHEFAEDFRTLYRVSIQELRAFSSLLKEKIKSQELEGVIGGASKEEYLHAILNPNEE